MGEFQIAFSPHANRDLEQIVRYIARDNPNAAERFGEKLVSRALNLAKVESVSTGAKVQKRPGVRKLIEGNYLIFYRILSEQKKVRILRFWHAARDPKTLRLDV